MNMVAEHDQLCITTCTMIMWKLYTRYNIVIT